ncbi:MAG: FG-GAP-like repeat-containing protein, partial [Planctomycetes bacterium]|nr:FG-GAP-like repeat-containing protein [Planctomycetota bacterium]
MTAAQIGVGIALFSSCIAHGQEDRREGSRVGERFNLLDRNNDGALTAEEARGLPQFKEIDADNDGKVTPDEVRTWRRTQREGAQQPDAMDGELPEDAATAKSIFRLAYIHKGSLAQASALLDVFGNGHPDILIACKRRVYLVKNNGKSSFAHAQTYDVDNANGWGAHDFNADGCLDAFVAQQQREQDDCWINNGDGTFTRRDLGNETVGNTRSVLFADFDGDGHVDSYHSVSAFGTNHAGCELHPGKADNTFGPDIIRQVLEPGETGFWYATATHPERGNEEWANKMFKGAVVRDFDGDGKPDIITAAYADLGFQEGGPGGIGQRWVEQQDRGLFVLHNRSEPGCIRFTEVARQAIGEYAYGNTTKHWNCYSVVPLDYDRDGDSDLFVGAVTRRHGRRPEDTRCVALYENISQPGQIRFIDRTQASGFGRFNEMTAEQRWQINFASGAAMDYDNDGWVDLCLINRRDMDRTRWPYPHLFRNTGKGTFVEVPASEHGIGGGAGGRDLNYADLDGDGRLDVNIHDGTVGGYDGQDNTRIYMNHSANENRWVGLNVVRGDKSTPAIGVRVV